MNYHVAFAMGIKVAELTHNIDRSGREIETADAMMRLVYEVAEGTLTLLNTPEEELARMPPIPAELVVVPEFRDRINKIRQQALTNLPEARAAERQMAQLLVVQWEKAGMQRPK